MQLIATPVYSVAKGGGHALCAGCWLPQADDIAFHVREPGKGSRRNLYRRHDRFSARGFDFLERPGHVVGFDVEVCEPMRLMTQRGDVAWDARRGAGFDE